MKHYIISPRLFILIILVSSLASCDPGYIVTTPDIAPESRQKQNVYYVPAAPNAPLLTEKNDMNINAMRSTGSRYNGWELQGAYLATKHIGLMGNYSFGKNGGGAPDFMQYKKFELGGGYTTPVAHNLNFETYAGAGNSKITNYHYSGMSHVDYTNLFIQPGIAFNNDMKTVQVGFVSKISGVNFDIDTLFRNYSEPFSTKQAVGLYDQPFHVFLEPGLIVRVGWKNGLFHFNYNYSADLTNSALHRPKDNFNVGVSIRFNTSKDLK